MHRPLTLPCSLLTTFLKTAYLWIPSFRLSCGLSRLTCYSLIQTMALIQQTAYVSISSMSQQARQSKYEREKTEFVVSAYYDYRTQLITRKEFLKKVCHRYGPITDGRQQIANVVQRLLEDFIPQSSYCGSAAGPHHHHHHQVSLINSWQMQHVYNVQRENSSMTLPYTRDKGALPWQPIFGIKLL